MPYWVVVEDSRPREVVTTVWAKISTSTASVACAACIATAVTLPAMGVAAERVAKISNANVKLAVDFSQLDGFNAIPAYLDLLGGDLSSLADLDGFNGLFAYAALLGGDPLAASGGLAATNGIPAYVGAAASAIGGGARGVVDALGGVDNFSALPAYADILSGNLDSIGDLDSVNGLPAYSALASGDLLGAASGLDATNGIPSLAQFVTTRNVDEFRATDNNAGYDALSALPEYRDVLSGDVSALGNVDAFSALSALAAPPPSDDPDAGTDSTTSTAAAPEQTADPSGAPADAGNPLRSVVQRIRAAIPKPPELPKPQAKSAVAHDTAPQTEETDKKVSAAEPKPKAQPAATSAPDPERPGEQTKTDTTPDNSGAGSQNVSRSSRKFTPGSIGDTSVLFGAGTPSADDGMRGWASSLKKLGIGGGDSGESSKHSGESSHHSGESSKHSGGASGHHGDGKGGK